MAGSNYAAHLYSDEDVRILREDVGSYYEWLEAFTIDERVSEHQRLSYKHLIKKLWDIPFHGLNGNDEDRAIDGVALRDQYDSIVVKNVGVDDLADDAVGSWISDIYGDCRVLEMLVALSMRMYDIMEDMDIYNSVSRWFWEIMENVGFDILDDSCWFEDRGEWYVNRVVNSIMNGDGGRTNEAGGWFYIHGWPRMEIWYQMHTYLQRFF